MFKKTLRCFQIQKCYEDDSKHILSIRELKGKRMFCFFKLYKTQIHYNLLNKTQILTKLFIRFKQS